MWRAKVPHGGFKGTIVLNTALWYDARDLCRQLYPDTQWEPLWTQMLEVEEKDLVGRDKVYSRGQYRDVALRVVQGGRKQRKA